jgi:hypothetical protein
MKTCSNCKNELPLSEFSPNVNGKHKVASRCRKCKNELTRSWYNQNLDRERERNRVLGRKIALTPNGRAGRLFAGIRNRDPNTDLTVDWIADKIEKGFCEVTGLPFDLERDGERTARAFCPSIDRIDCSKGYTTDNVQVVCWIYNRSKGVDSHETVLRFAEAICKKIS